MVVVVIKPRVFNAVRQSGRGPSQTSRQAQNPDTDTHDQGKPHGIRIASAGVWATCQCSAGLYGNIGPGDDCNADVGSNKGGSVIHAVADHGNTFAMTGPADSS